MDTKIFSQPDNTLSIPENRFDFGNFNSLTCHAGYLIPVYAKKMMPGETYNFGPDIFGRLMPLINPVYSNIKLYVYHYFVPTRLSYPHFDRFRSGKKVSNLDGDKSYIPIAPRTQLWEIALNSSWSMYEELQQQTPLSMEQFNYVGIWTNSLPDYLNMPCTNEVWFNSEFKELYDTPLVNLDDFNGDIYRYFQINTGNTIVASALSYFDDADYDYFEEPKRQGARLIFIEKFIAYTLIWYDYFRDWRLEDYEYSPYDFIHECNEKYDNNYSYYFNDIDFVIANPQLNWFSLRHRTFTSDMFVSAFPTPQLGDPIQIPQVEDFQLLVSNAQNGDVGFALPVDGDHLLSLTSNTSPAEFKQVGSVPTIDQLHAAEKFQKYFQLLMQHNIRQQDLDKLFYGIKSSKPFDTPLFVAGDSMEFQVQEVIQTTGTDDAPLGDFAGRGSLASRSFEGSYTADEFGYFMTLVSIVPEQSYFQGMPREFTRNWDIYDLPNTMFADLGFDNINNEEVFFNVANNNGNMTDALAYDTNHADFGYMTRYIDYRSANNEIHGSFRSSLTNWHLSRVFREQPGLNKFFTNVNWLDFNRIFAVQQFSHPNIMLLVHNVNYKKTPLPYYCNPF